VTSTFLNGITRGIKSRSSDVITHDIIVTYRVVTSRQNAGKNQNKMSKLVLIELKLVLNKWAQK